jgi:hypothetical protein
MCHIVTITIFNHGIDVIKAWFKPREDPAGPGW